MKDKKIAYQLMFSREDITKLDECRWQNRLPSRAATIRFLIEKGLASEDAENNNGGSELDTHTAVTANRSDAQTSGHTITG